MMLGVASLDAHAGGVNLSWDDCGLAGVGNKSFACDTNGGVSSLFVSFEPNSDMADMVGVDIRLELQAADESGFASWWQLFNAGTCRRDALTVNPVAVGTGCVSPWLNPVFGGIGSLTLGKPYVATMLLFYAMQDPVAVSPGTEYVAARIDIDHSLTTGPSACTGCHQGVGFVVWVLQLDGASGAFQKIEVWKDRSWACWQCGCGFYYDNPDPLIINCPETPAYTRTWGQIKSLYR